MEDLEMLMKDGCQPPAEQAAARRARRGLHPAVFQLATMAGAAEGSRPMLGPNRGALRLGILRNYLTQVGQDTCSWSLTLHAGGAPIPAAAAPMTMTDGCEQLL